MTREEKLYSMRMQELAMVAEKLGIKINTKAAKSAAIEKILAAEEMNKKNEKELKKEEAENDAYVAEVMQQKKDLGIEVAKIDPENDSIEIISETPAKLVPMPGTEDPNWGENHYAPKPERKRGALIEYNGKAQNICAWAKELNKSANTLYSRLYILGWDVEKAFTK